VRRQRLGHYEIARQTKLIDSGLDVAQETLLWNAARGMTVSMRSKEESHDYRYFPDPDLVPVVVDDAYIRGISSRLPELPAARRLRFAEIYGLPAYDAEQLTQIRSLGDYFEECVKLLDSPKEISNWIMSEVVRVLNEKAISMEELLVTPAMLTALVSMLKDGAVSGLAAKEIFSRMAHTGKPALEIMKELGLEQVSDEDALKKIILEVIESSPKETAQYRSGKVQLLGFFVGEVMKRSKGKANPKVSQGLIKELLSP
jgi:aspartyl-tRNA(Asn)/glutamyl-tRNA(Gln) amidotransferase subunit B